MPLFMCSNCRCVENTALAGGGYWRERALAQQEKREPEVKCSECATGKWHGQFQKESAKGWFRCSDGFLYSKEDLKFEKRRFGQQNISVVEEVK